MLENAKVEMKMYFLVSKGCFFTTEAQITQINTDFFRDNLVICASVVNL
jgi:hypothetical protein